MIHPETQHGTIRRLGIRVRGVVQGVGFRPFVYNAACGRGLSGWVRNEADQVHIEVQGEAGQLERFVEAIRQEHPSPVRIEALDVRELPCDGGLSGAFAIVASAGQGEPRPTIPADLATCRACLREIADPAEHRYHYPFTNCTACGPRWSIIRQLPYDRPRTAMAGFVMCPQCRAEYENPADRRFHAQPIACPSCGPALQLLDAAGAEMAVGPGALEAAAEAIRAGRIVAIKGLGGFQLLADATHAAAVARLRQRKRRPDRPFALMLPSLEAVRRRCQLSEQEARVLQSPEAPILLLHRRRDPQAVRDIAGGVAPGNPYLGVMLPHTPLHHLLMAALQRPIICTSGNLADEPMAITTEDALRRLVPIVDLLLTHDRPIVRPVDDSVARVGPDGLQLLRRARGYAPLPIDLGLPAPTILALGGHLKNTVALALGTPAERGEGPSAPVVVSQHVGDLDNVLSIEVFRRTVDDLLEFFRARPEVVACDLHPDYASTRHAETLCAQWDVPLVRVQHHHAHVAACMAEHRLKGPLLGLAWDGTGYGGDGTVWGGEALVCEGARFTRVAHLRTFALPGGDRAVREPRRSAFGALYEILGPAAVRHAAAWFKPGELNTLLGMLQRRVHTPRTSSMGRLFDAVSALCGLGAVISFEGQAAMALEYAADSREDEAYPLPLGDRRPWVADWEPLLRAVLADRAAGISAGRISARFHNAVVEMAVAVARRAGCSQVVLSGGCFQNALLSERIRQRLSAEGFNAYTHRCVPPGDGGIALGQVYVAAQRGGGSKGFRVQGSEFRS